MAIISLFISRHSKELSHDVRAIFSTLCTGRYYHAPLIEKRGPGIRRGSQLSHTSYMLLIGEEGPASIAWY